MIKHMLSSALFAGFAVGLLTALLQYAFVEKDILLAEQYESGALVHFAPGPGAEGHVAMGAGNTAATETGAPAGTADEMPATSTAAENTEAGHDQDKHQADAETPPLQRHAKTVFFAIVTYTGYALLLVAAYAFAGQFGQQISVQTGLLWGLAGFAAFQLAPALGLEPEMPGTPSANLDTRQWWWVATALTTVAGLGLLAYGKGLVARLAGVALLALPHAIGAPELDSYSGVTPPELASSFAARTLGVGLIAWVTLGGLLAWFWTGKET